MTTKLQFNIPNDEMERTFDWFTDELVKFKTIQTIVYTLGLLEKVQRH